MKHDKKAQTGREASNTTIKRKQEEGKLLATWLRKRRWEAGTFEGT
jgi:hypothetical protein